MSDPTMIPGVYQSVDQQRLKILAAQQEKMMMENRERGKKYSKHKNEYLELKERLSTLNDKTSHEVMIPMGKKAFMPGKLVHTNEILVLLGDNWFAERSCKEATEIVDRRLQKCQEMLDKLNQEAQLIQGWKRETETLEQSAKSGEGNMEIREEYDEETEKIWRQKHRQNMKKERSKNKPEDISQEDQDLWKRLDELELEEEMDKYLEEKHEDESVREQDESDWSQSEGLSDDEEDESVGKKVVFADEERPAKVPTIHFKHSEEEIKTKKDPLAGPEKMTPGDLSKLHNIPKSILKPFNDQDLQVYPTIPEPMLNPVAEQVVERDANQSQNAQPERKQSKFKQSRIGRK